MSESFLYQLLMFYPVFLFSLTVHEVAHALTANWGGDLTATYQDRLTLNPVAHMDIIGTVLIPILMLTGPGFIVFGWAKPVPVQEQNFRDKAWNVVVAMAGPFSNILLVVIGALIFSFIIRLAHVGTVNDWWTLAPNFESIAIEFFSRFVALNWILCFFNLIPVPPLDGSHVVYHFFIRGRGGLYAFWHMLQRFGFILFYLVYAFTPVGYFLGAWVRFLTNATFNLLVFPGMN